ncbi:MAG: polysaccharide deacetylase family protein [Candidatus Omnitrophica bacterium]|nr:polysaccharide deacetylase family protein [Candidatus Omnitrophota bacterium]
MGRLVYVLLLLSIWLPPTTDAVAVQREIPVMLSFDTERQEDREALEKLQLNEPATYFFTGRFAEENRDFVARIARGNNTIGSHSYAHPHLTQLDSVALAEDLGKAKDVLESITGKPVVWFRAPYMEYNERVMRVLKQLDFLYDSSDQDRWQRQDVLYELPISTFQGGQVLASDYELMYRQELNEKEFARWLKMLYNEKAAIGQPVMILLHPRMVARYPDAFRAFIAYVKQEKGVFLSADNYVELLNSRAAHRYAVWVDFSLGRHNPEEVARDISDIGATDVFLMAQDASGRSYYDRNNDSRDLFGETAKRLKKAGIRVHAWLPALIDSAAAGRHPEWAMVAQNGTASEAWLSPTNPKVIGDRVRTIRQLFRNYELDGLHLGELRYPGLAFDYAGSTLQAYTLKTGQDSVPSIRELLNAQYLEWTNWRAAQIAMFTERVKRVVRQEAGTKVELSASLDGSAATSYTSAELYAQNYGLIASHLDLLVAVADFSRKGHKADWISQVIFSARNRAFSKPLLTGISAVRDTGEETYGPEEFAHALAFAGRGADGIGVYPYLYLFGRGEEEKNMPQGSTELLRTMIEAHRPGERMLLGGLTETTVPLVQTVFAAMVLFILNFVAIPVFGRSFRISEETDAPEEALPDKDWKEIDAEIAAGSIDGATAEKVTMLLRRYDAQKIQQNRIALVLDVTGTSEDPLHELYGLLNDAPEWKALALKYFHETSLLGYATIDEQGAALTESGRSVLDRAKSEGFEREFWVFIEKMLHETAVVNCPYCGTENLVHFFWNSFECAGCGKTVRFRDCDMIEVQPVDADENITVRTFEFV